MDTPDISQKSSSCLWYLLVVDVTGLVVDIIGVALKLFLLDSPLALFPGVPIVEFKVLLSPDLTDLEGVTV